IIDVEWDTGQASTYQVEIVIEALDRTRLLQDVSIAMADAGVNVLSAAVSTDRQGIATMRFLFELGDMEQLSKVLNTVKAVDGVFDAKRMLPEGGSKKGASR
ncbi:MAG: bifunctional (p)ppGpp synthetase/guanosine-3',5'-bis(diphosphate) 3'-pyrophosphohydrolase, partial [Coriobacteriia bacterium]|nr:bifunctional (p)ppGpp synthetase/guanosine-3',5'-bis(diphosphate) 3'-pyrophosphohydrolase [Coriobacteriia bacterium]